MGMDTLLLLVLIGWIFVELIFFFFFFIFPILVQFIHSISIIGCFEACATVFRFPTQNLALVKT